MLARNLYVQYIIYHVFTDQRKYLCLRFVSFIVHIQIHTHGSCNLTFEDVECMSTQLLESFITSLYE